MKKILLLTAIMVASLGAYGQGTVEFANLKIVGGERVIDARVSNETGGFAGAGYVAQLLAGPTDSALVAVGDPVPFLTTSDASMGYFLGGNRTTTLPAGSEAFLQVRAWKLSDPDLIFGNSNTIKVTLGGAGAPPSLPAIMTGLQPFQIQIIPEPSTLALGLLGAGALLLRRRK